MDVFAHLSEPSLLALISAIESQELTTGNRLLLARFLSATETEPVGAEIDRLLDEGLRPLHLAYLLKTVFRTQQNATNAASRLELVWSGPESGSTVRDTGVVVRELFASAEHSVLIAGFAVHRGREIFKELASRMLERPDLEVRLFLNIARALRDTTVADQLVGRFAHEFRRDHWPGPGYPAIFFDPRAIAMDEKKRTSMHAKCVVVDGVRSLVTSANFTEAAQQRNIEVGVLIKDERFSKMLVEQFDALIRDRAVERLPLG